jgi:kinetochore protein Nuf2
MFAMQLNAEIEECNEARERELPLVQEVDSKVKELRQTIAGLNNQQMSLRASFRKLKEKTGEMDEKVRLLKMSTFIGLTQ